MADFKILCPACASVLSSKKPISNGKRITCPHCHKPFVAATSEAASSSDSGSLEFDLASPAAPPGRSSPKHEASKTREMPSLVSSRYAPAKSGSRGVLLWLLVIGLVILAGAGGAAGMYFYLHHPETSLAQKLKGPEGAKDGTDHTDAKPPAKSKTKTDKSKATKGATAPENQSGADQGEGAKQVAAAVPTDKPAPAVAPKTAAPKPAIADWKEFKSAKGGFVVQFPAKPEEFQERDEDIIYYGTRTELNGFDYEITFHRLKKDDLATPPAERLKKIAGEFKTALITQKDDIDIKGVPKAAAVELTVYKNDKKDVAVERWLVHKEHVFQISVCGDKARIGPDQVALFMESFRFVADPQGDFLDLTKTTGIPPERKKK